MGTLWPAIAGREGILEEVSVRVQKRLLALQINDIMQSANISKTGLAEKMNTDVTQLNRPLDPDNTSITLESLDRLARAVGKRLRIAFADAGNSRSISNQRNYQRPRQKL